MHGDDLFAAWPRSIVQKGQSALRKRYEMDQWTRGETKGAHETELESPVDERRDHGGARRETFQMCLCWAGVFARAIMVGTVVPVT